MHTLLKSNPTENETLKKAPSVVKIEFDEDIQISSFNTLYVRDTSGKRVDLKDAHIDKKNKAIRSWIGRGILKMVSTLFSGK